MKNQTLQMQLKRIFMVSDIEFSLLYGFECVNVQQRHTHVLYVFFI